MCACVLQAGKPAYQLDASGNVSSERSTTPVDPGMKSRALSRAQAGVLAFSFPRAPVCEYPVICVCRITERSWVTGVTAHAVSVI
jgi:hypothetical protein